MLDKDKKNSMISAVSNLITFKTLKTPFIRFTHKEDDQLEIEIALKCKFTFEDLDLKEKEIKENLDPYNICDSYNITYNSSVNISKTFFLVLLIKN